MFSKKTRDSSRFFRLANPIQQTNSILSSIAENGLQAKKNGLVSSIASGPADYADLCYNLLPLTLPGAGLDASVRHLVLSDKNGLYAIAAERKYIFDAFEHEFSNATLNSIVFVFNKTLTGNDRHTALSDFSGTLDQGLSPEFKSHYNEIRLHDPDASISASDILCIMVPIHLMAFVKEHFPAKTIIPVYPHIQNIKHIPMGPEIQLINSGRRTSDVSLTRILAPNYERALHMALASISDASIQAVGVHLTRLPNIFVSDANVPLEESKERYLSQSNKRVMRYTNVGPRLLQSIQNANCFSEIGFFKEKRHIANQYLGIATKEQHEQLGLIVKAHNEASIPDVNNSMT